RRHFTQVTGITGTVQQVVAGGQHSFILTDKGLYACGSNMLGQLGLGDNQDRAHFTQVTGMTGTVQQIGAGGYNSFIFTDKGLYGCGINNGNQLGHEGHLTTFQPIPAITPKAIKANGKHYQPFTRLIKASETLTFFSQTPSSNTIAQTPGSQEQQALEDLVTSRV
ncbi:MAG: hypothetical protein K0S11_434, partial [Gammaproteobacteria bacterium]|nr:hypothetical protein [Gammaproteobacteria bacterium]